MELELADITSKITAFDQNFSNLELIDQKINERVSKLEARMQVAEENPKITNIEQNLSNLKINEDLATKRPTKLEQQVEEEIRTMTRDMKTQSKNHSSVLSIFLTFS